jgi:MoaA/NifB/PqqE/SkfB family radical SAM enzyme
MDNEHYKKITNRDVDFNQIVENVKYLHSIKENAHIHIKCIRDYFSKEQQEEFIKIFSPYCDSINLENVAHLFRDVQVDKKDGANRFGLNLTSSQICPYPFYRMVIRHTGKVTTCPGDRNCENVIGDANTESLIDIWNGKALYDLRMDVLYAKAKEKYPFCSKCEFIECQSSEDLTPYRKDLIKKYEREDK